jgi:CheY-like chemotaxis protein
MKPFTKISFVIPLVIMSVITILGYSAFSSNDESKNNSLVKTSLVGISADELRANMRKLWEDHVTWTRNVTLCLVDELPGTDQAIKRLLQNQIDIGSAFKPYYGQEAGNKLTQLLCTHINISDEVVKAAKAGNTEALEKNNTKWYANADQISEFLCKANPNWILADMKMMMANHLKITTDEVMQRIKKDYNADVIAYDKINKEILLMADILTEGIIKQFPEKFEIIATK